MSVANAYVFHGQRLRVSSNSPGPLQSLRHLYGRFLDLSDSGDNGCTQDPSVSDWIVIDDHLEDSNLLNVSHGPWRGELRSAPDGFRLRYRMSDGPECPEVVYPSLYSFYQAIMISAVGHRLQETHVFVHAASLSWQGQGVIFPGAPGSGKSTLSVHLARRGFRFLSDEIACYDLQRRQLEPHPRSVRLRKEAAGLLGLDPDSPVGVDDEHTGKWIADIVEFAGPAVSIGESCALRHVFVLDGMGARPAAEPIPSHVGLRAILAGCFNPTEDGAATLTRISPMVSRARCYRLTMGSLRDTAEMMIAHCDEDASNAVR